MAILFGHDFSDFDWNRGARPSMMKKSQKEGIRFVTGKITEGTTTRHTHTGEMLKAAVAAGIPFVGVYIVTRTPGNNGNGSVSAQVNYAIAETTRQFPQWKSHKGFFFQCDLEVWPYDNVAAKHGVEMCRLLEARTGKKAVVYAPKWAYNNSVGGSYPLWASNYNGSGAAGNFKTQWKRTAEMSHPGWGKYSGRKPRILQYSSDATIGGQRTCDANVFDGSEVDFAKMIGGSTSTGGLDLSTRVKIADWQRANWPELGKDISVATALGSGYGHLRGTKGYAKAASDELTDVRAEVNELKTKLNQLTTALGLLLPSDTKE